MIMQAIQTKYAGCRFRSRLEARYAVLFDHLGVQWDYEPEGYSTPAGPYLPDFLLHLKKPVLFEVKPEPEINNEEDARWPTAAQIAGLPLIVAYGIPKPARLDPCETIAGNYNGRYQKYFEEGGWDNQHAFCVCPRCGELGVEFNGRGERICGTDHGQNDADAYTYDNPGIVAAYRAALSARFEHGETPKGIFA